jgi:mannose-6-phosphate isomerase-like protein (cupin superfamily)
MTDTQTDRYTIHALTDTEDMAPKYGLDEQGEARFATEDLAAEQTGVSLQSLLPGKRQAFGHHHEQAEEIYVVLSGSGRVKLDDDIEDIKTLDAIRVAPAVTRAFEAGPDGLQLLAFGPRHRGDGEVLQGWWSD